MKAPGSDQLSKYEANMRSKSMEVSAVARKIDKWLAKQCVLIGFDLHSWVCKTFELLNMSMYLIFLIISK